MAAANLKTTLSLNDSNFRAKIDSACNKAKSSLAQVGKSTKGLGGILGSLSPQLQSLTSNFSGMLESAKGLANPYTAAAMAIGAGAVAFVKYNSELERTLNLTAQYLKIEPKSDALNSIRNGIKGLADATQQDFQTILDGVDGVMSQFGVNAEHALQIVKSGFIAMGEKGQQFLPLLQQYGPALKDIGMSAEEATAVIAQARSGIFNEQGLGAIQMAGKNIKNMSTATQKDLNAIGISSDEMVAKLQNGSMTITQAIQQISARLKELNPQSQEVGAVLQDVFGKKGTAAGQELINSLATMSTNLEDVMNQTGEEGRLIGELADVSREWENALQTLFGVSDSGLSHLTTQLKIGVLKTMTKVIMKIVDIYNKSVLVRGLVQAIGVSIREMWASVKAVLKIFADALIGLGEMLEGIVTLNFDTIAKGFDRIATSVTKNVGELGRAFGDAVKDAWKNTQNGHIKVVATVDMEDEEIQPTNIGGGSSKGSGSGKGKSGGASKAGIDKTKQEIKFLQGSLADLENQLNELKNKYKNGFLKISKEDFAKQVEALEEKIKDKKVELGLAFENDSLKSLQDQLKELQDRQNSADLSLHLDTKEFYRQVADLTQKIQRKQVFIMLEADPNSLAALELQLKNLEENQKSENINLHIPAQDYKLLHEELQRQIEDQKIQLGISLSKDDLDKQLNELLQPEQSSWDLTIPTPSPKSIDEQLNFLQEQMSLNDELIKSLKQLSDEYLKLGDSGSDGLDRINERLTEAVKKQKELQKQAKDSNDKKVEMEGLSKGLNDAAENTQNLASAFGSLSQIKNDDVGLNIAATVGQSVANIMLAVSQAIARATAEGGWVGWLTMGTTIFAQGMALAAQIKSITSGYAGGGILNFGSQVGDKNVIRVNGGEAILNKTQQSRLWRILDGQQSVYSNTGFGGNVKFEIDGRKLVGVLSNTSKQLSKI